MADTVLENANSRAGAPSGPEVTFTAGDELRGEGMADDSDSGGVFDPMADIGTQAETVSDSSGVDTEGVTEVTTKSWLERLMDAVIGVLIGLVLVLATCGGLFWNEGRAVQTSRSLAEGSGLVVDADPSRVEPANEGKLVHLQGELKTGARLADPDLLVDAQAARLVRTPEMFQWKEETRTETHKKLGGGEETVTHYSYTHVWSDRRIDSSHFRQRTNHENPQMRFAKFETAARDASLGAFRPGPTALERLPARETLRVDAALAEKLRAKLGSTPVQVADGLIYLGQEPASPRVGDLRISYHVAPVGPVSLIGRQAGGDLQEFQTKAGDRLLMASPGLVPAADMFHAAEQENVFFTWVLRIVGIVVMWIGWYFVLRPIAVVGDVVPFIGSVLAAGAGIAAFLLTAALAPVVMAIAWLWYRPLLSIGLIAAGAAVAYGIRMLAHRKVARAPAPAIPPAAAPA
jgi:hypothetical protein